MSSINGASSQRPMYLSVTASARLLLGFPQQPAKLKASQRGELHLMEQRIRFAHKKNELVLQTRQGRAAAMFEDLMRWASQHRGPWFSQDLILPPQVLEVSVAEGVSASASVGDVFVVAGDVKTLHAEVLRLNAENQSLKATVVLQAQLIAKLEPDAKIGRLRRKVASDNGKLARGIKKHRR